MIQLILVQCPSKPKETTVFYLVLDPISAAFVGGITRGRLSCVPPSSRMGGLPFAVFPLRLSSSVIVFSRNKVHPFCFMAK